MAKTREAETGFGTGLRDRLDPEVEELEAAPEDEPVAEEPVVDPRAELEERARALAEAEAELGRRERLLAEHQEQILEAARVLTEREQELEAVPPAADVRSVLRARAERHAERVWRSFAQALEATRPDGSVDHATRLAAAQALLAEAYGASDGAAVPPAVDDELAPVRERRAGRHLG